MRHSQLFGRSIRLVPQDVRSRGHEFLLRGGFIRESTAGRFYMLPLDLRVQERVINVIPDEVDAVGRDAMNPNYGRYFSVEILTDIAITQDGHRAVSTGSVLRERRGIEVGNIFLLGTWYSERMRDAVFTNTSGERQNYHMGCYGIGIGRTLATIAETHHDECGLRWPKSATPFDIHLVQLGNDEASARAASDIYSRLVTNGQRVLFDDRDVSAGVKFADADLLGISERYIVSKKLTNMGSFEVRHYRSDQTSIIPL